MENWTHPLNLATSAHSTPSHSTSVAAQLTPELQAQLDLIKQQADQKYAQKKSKNRSLLAAAIIFAVIMIIVTIGFALYRSQNSSDSTTHIVLQ